MKAWTYFADPLTVGGYINKAKGFKFEGKEKVVLGKGYFGYVLQSPKGKTIIVESQSGAIIGNDLNIVKSDIQQGDSDIMKKQVEQAIKETITLITEQQFWSRYK
jgi:hypothetical protein